MRTQKYFLKFTSCTGGERYKVQGGGVYKVQGGGVYKVQGPENFSEKGRL